MSSDYEQLIQTSKFGWAYWQLGWARSTRPTHLVTHCVCPHNSNLVPTFPVSWTILFCTIIIWACKISKFPGACPQTPLTQSISWGPNFCICSGIPQSSRWPWPTSEVYVHNEPYLLHWPSCYMKSFTGYNYIPSGYELRTSYEVVVVCWN